MRRIVFGVISSSRYKLLGTGVSTSGIAGIQALVSAGLFVCTPEVINYVLEVAFLYI